MIPILMMKIAVWNFGAKLWLVQREKEEKEKSKALKAHKANNTMCEMKELWAQFHVLDFESSEQKDLLDQKISSLKEDNRDLHKQLC